MFVAEIVCSDPACFEELEVIVEDLAELDRYVCDCGCGFVLARVAGLR
ncbi:MAG TPA: hypothetical protein VKA88_00420 [Solirubrobacterales bacterium]|nr:hypothetical protein [Solirubrobacterales bacterium]